MTNLPRRPVPVPVPAALLALATAACTVPPKAGTAPGEEGTGESERGITVPLVRLEDEPPGDHCAGGGVAVDAGVDGDEDGQLGDAEVQDRFFVCHGELGPQGAAGGDGARALVRLTPEAPGAHCEGGGAKVDSGLDLDGDGTLGDIEVQSTAYVCHGARGGDGRDGAAGADGADGADGAPGGRGAPGVAGRPSLLRITVSEPGDECLAGGWRVEAGVDVDGDGALSDGEVTAAATVCNGEPGADGDDGQDGRDGRDGRPGGGGGPGALLRLVPIGPGPVCAGGGVLIRAGVDFDEDGELDDDEVEQEEAVCNGSLCDSPEFHDGGDGSCIAADRCIEGFHDGGDGSCVPEGQCVAGRHDGGGGLCVPEGECAPNFRPDPLGGGGCVPACAPGQHDDGRGRCVPVGGCAEGYHDGGDGSCVPQGRCLFGFRDGGDGSCVPLGQCARRYIDVNGVCVVNENRLYDFGTHRFTTCGQAGRSGPSIQQCDQEYRGAPFVGDRLLFDVVGGIQQWSVPEGGAYRIEVRGAQGGGAGGNGAYVRGDFDLALGDVLSILVGQRGGDSPNEVGDGGGGGSFVVREDGSPLIIAGGGGGTGHNNAVTDAARMQGQTGRAGNDGHLQGAGAGGQDGRGGAAGMTSANPPRPNAGGGGGLLTDGGSAPPANGGRAFVNGGLGGDSTGGFGGGGGSNVFIYGCGASPHGGSGGGGYSGGGGGGTNCNGVGGGGGSYNTGANPVGQVGARPGHGEVVITRL